MLESITIHSGHIQTLLKNKNAKQILALYTSMAFGLILGLAVSIINTRLLGPQHYGDLKFLQNLFFPFRYPNYLWDIRFRCKVIGSA